MASVESNDLFPVRTINFLGRDVPTLGQNEFGPCALLGVVNALLLRGTLKVSSDHGALTLQDVLARLADRLVEVNQGDNPDVRAALDGAVTRLPTLAEGLDVNVKFNGGFEFTSDLAIFDLLDVRLVHGWRVDGENDAATAEALGSRSYNECIQEVVQLRSNELEGAAKARAALVSTFLERTQTQLTYAGLAEIHATLRENEVGVLYRNLHFSTVFKRDGVLYALVTDIGYRQQRNVVWERLDDVGGDTDFCDASFKPAAPTSSEDPDHLLALQLARDDEAARERERAAGATSLPVAAATEVVAAPGVSKQHLHLATPDNGAAAVDADYQAALALSTDGAPRADADADAALARQLQRAEADADAALARQLQAEEDAAARARPPPPPAAAQARPVRRPPKKKSSQCVVA